MKWSAKIGRFAGIDVYVHVTFLALLAYVAATDWRRTGSLTGVAFGLGVVLMLFVCVLLHEYGHALTARRFGIGTRHITLLPIGGVAVLEDMPRDPRQEVLVALAGPAVNFAIAAAVYAIIVAQGGQPFAAFTGDLGRMGLLPSLLGANLLLGVFNLLPAFPMDGGRVLRAALSFRMDRVRATRIAATVGQALAVGLGLVGLNGNPVLLLIAVFVWLAARAEANAVEAETRLARQPAARAMITEFRTLSPQAPLAQAIDFTLAGSQKSFPVVAEDGRVVGLLTQGAVLRGLRDHGPSGRVSEVMEPVATADIRATLGQLLGDLDARGAGLVCILSEGRLVGLVDLDNIAEFLRIQAALGRR